MISYIDIVQFLMLGVLLVFGAGHILSLRTMNKFLDEQIEVDSRMHDFWRENRTQIFELEAEKDMMYKNIRILEGEIHRIDNILIRMDIGVETAGIVHTSKYQGGVTLDEPKEGQI